MGLVEIPFLILDQEIRRPQQLLLQWHRQRLSSPVSPVRSRAPLSKLPHTHPLRQLHITQSLDERNTQVSKAMQSRSFASIAFPPGRIQLDRFIGIQERFIEFLERGIRG